MRSTSYAPSEAAIEAAIERRIGSAGFFQRVAEHLARGIYVDLADGLVPFGRRPDDKTTAGWPDAYLTKVGGALIAIEATTAGNARTGHWPHDLAKLEARLAPERRGGLIWVAWCDASMPTDAGEMRDQACRLGLPGEDVHIIFRKDLCARLRAPFHARFWINDLDLRVTSEPFSRVKDVIGRANIRRSTGIFPTAEEYEEDRVYAPPVLAKVEKALAEQRATMVVGHGAAGKTTLAMVLSHRPRFRHAPTYYLDLTATATDPTLAERAGEAIAAVADRGVLFIIDNAHLDPEAAVRVFEQWGSFGNGSDLLILTRRVRSRLEAWDDEPELEAIPLPCLDLVIQPADLEGIYRRLYRARNNSGAPPVRSAVLAQWHRLFGGDLLAFSAAVLELLDRGGELAALEAADARAYLRKRYLVDPEFVPEQLALLDLAAVAAVEGLVPIEAFAEDALKTCVRHGLVWVETQGLKGTHKVYRLAHPGLGTLLRDAADRAETSRDDRCRVLQAHPFACSATSIRLQKDGEIAEARALLEALWREAEWPLAGMSLSHWGGALRITRDLQVLTVQDISARARTWLARATARAALVEAAFIAPLSHLVRFSAYAQQEIPEVYKTLREEIAAEKNRAALVERALTTRVGGLAQFLVYAHKELPEIEKALRGELAAETKRAALVKLALGTPLDGLLLFLTYAQQEMPEVYKALREEIAAEKNRTALVERALTTKVVGLAQFLVYAQKELPEIEKALRGELAAETKRAALVKLALGSPLDGLPLFLTYAQQEMPDVEEAIHDELAKHPAALVERALASPLDQLASFLTYAHQEMPDVAKALRDELTAEKNRTVLADHYITGGPEKVPVICGVDTAFIEILSAIDAGSWSRRWSERNLGQPNWFIGFASYCYRAGRADLVGTIANAIVRTARAQDFPSPGITVRHLTFILTSPHDCSPVEVEDFFARCLGPNWLAAQYQSQDASVGALAGAVRSVAADERVWIGHHFRHPTLLERVRAEQPTSGHSPRRIAEWLQLFCAARLLDRHMTHLRPVGFLQLSGALKTIPPGPPDQGIQPMQASLWAGLREWCHVSCDRPVVDAALAEGILAQFRAADPVGWPRLAALNAVMIDWLERCQDQNWRLVVDQDSLIDALERQLRVQDTAGSRVAT